MGLFAKPEKLKPISLLVEDHPTFAPYLSSLITKVFPEHEIVLLRSCSEVRAWIAEKSRSGSRAQLRNAFVDIGLPDGSGIDLIPSLLESNSPRIVVTSIFLEDAFLFEALSAGAFGYLLKSDEPEVFRETFERLLRDEPPISPRIARRILNHFHVRPKLATPELSLTPREKQTLALLVRGHTIPEVAKDLGLSAQTVSGYVKTTYQKLQVSSRAEATREAIRLGVV